MNEMMFLSKNWYFSVQKALIYYTVNKSHHNSFILLVFLHVANFRYVANFRFLTLMILKFNKFNMDDKLTLTLVFSVSGCRVLIVLTRWKLIIVYKDAIKSGKITIY